MLDMDSGSKDSSADRRRRYGRIAVIAIIVVALLFVLLEIQEFAHLNFRHFYLRK